MLIYFPINIKSKLLAPFESLGQVLAKRYWIYITYHTQKIHNLFMRNISWINLENLENLQQITNYHGENICVFYRLSTLFLIFFHLLFNGVQEASSSNLDTRTKISWQVSTRNLSTFLFSEIEIRKIKCNRIPTLAFVLEQYL